MSTLLLIPSFAAIGYSVLYLIFGGGLGGAALIFIHHCEDVRPIGRRSFRA